MKYVVANANEMLAVTGIGINEFILTRKKFVLPFQKCVRFTITPNNYEVSIKAMSQEKLSFTIPASISIGPDTKDDKQLRKYVSLMIQPGSESYQQAQIKARIDGIIIGELRAVASNMSVEEIYNNRKYFQSKVHEYISESLHKFGLIVYNSNIKEIGDKDGYFTIMGERASAAAGASAKVSVADSQAKGRIGATDRNCLSSRETTRLKADTQVFENERMLSIKESKTALMVKEAKYSADVKIAQIEAAKQAEMKEAELQRELEAKKLVSNIEKIRAEQLAKCIVEAESIRKMAEARAYELKKQSDAKLFQTMKEAEGKIFQKEREAEGIIQMLEAQSRGINEVLASFDNDEQSAMQFMMLEKDLFRQLAVENGKAIQNMKPQFNIWSTDEEEGATGGGLTNLLKSLPPLLSTIKEQTGISPPAWLANMPASDDSKQHPGSNVHLSKNSNHVKE